MGVGSHPGLVGWGKVALEGRGHSVTGMGEGPGYAGPAVVQ
jgi:hypothetical protein